MGNILNKIKKTPSWFAKRKQNNNSISNSTLNSHINNLPVVSYRYAVQNQIGMQFISSNVMQLTGYPCSDFVDSGKIRFDSIIYSKDINRRTKAIYSDTPQLDYDIDYRIVDYSGKIRWVNEKGRKIYRNNELLYIDGVLIEITQQKKLEPLSSIKSEALENTTFAVGMMDMDGNILYVNKAVNDLWGYEKNELIGASIQSLWDGPNLEHVKSKVIKDGSATTFGKAQRKDGTHLHLHCSIKLIRNKLGQAKQMIGSFIDISVQRNAKLELKHFNDLLNSAEKLGEMGSWSRNYKTKETNYSINVLHLLGISSKQFDGSFNSILGNIHPDDRLIFKSCLEIKYPENSKEMQYRVLIPNSKEFRTIESISKVRFDESGEPFEIIGIIRDISERKKNQEAINTLNKELEKRVLERTKELQKTSKAVSQSPVTIVITDPGGHIEYVNPKFTKTTGYNADEVLGKHTRIMHSGTHEKAFFAELWRTISSGKEWTGEIQNKKKDGELYWESVSISSIKNDDGKITNYVGIKEDISTRKSLEAQLKKAISSAQKANKAKSNFLASMSHEIRTPMNAIIGFSEILSRTVRDKTNIKYLNSIQSSSKSLLRLINDILDLSKIEAGKFEIQPEFVNINSIIENVEQLFVVKARERCLRFDITIDEQLPKSLFLDEIRLRQVLINLIGNAFKFTDEGAITVKVSAANCKNNVPNQLSLKIDVIDTGIGICKNNLKTIFAPFEQPSTQSNKRYGGTGLGLAICKQLVKAMNGQITVCSKLNRGSTFSITLNNVSYSDSIVENKKVEFDIDKVSFKPATILFADDVQSNQEYIWAALKGSNIKVISAKNGLQALKLCSEHKPNLVITDLKMPVMDGFRFLSKLKESKKLTDIPVICYSAGQTKLEQQRLNKLDFDGNLSKPATLNDLFTILMKFLPWENTENEKIVLDDKQLPHSTIELLPRASKELDLLYNKDWNTLQNVLATDKLNAFATKLVELGRTTCNPIIEEYGEKLKEALESYDSDRISSVFVSFPEVINTIKGLTTSYETASIPTYN